jgi:hypothetical protein
MANLSSLNNRIVINSNVISNPTAPNSVTLNSRRATDDLNRISSYINNILVPAFNTLSSGERYPFDVSQHGLGGSTIPTHLESCGNNNKLSELYWKISSEPGGGRPTTIKESFDYLNTRINYTLNLIQKPEISFPPEIGNLPEQVNNLFGYIKKMFFDLYSSPNQTHDLIPDINPTVPAYSTTSLIYQLYNQLFDVDLNGQGTPGNFYDLVDQSEKTGLTISLKNNLFVTELENLTDVNVAGKTDSQVLSWNAAQEKWIPVDKDSGPGYTGTTYDAATGKVTFNSDYPELVLTTGDLRGPAGANGQSALWNVRGPWDINQTYQIGDVVQLDGSLYYKHSNPMGNTDIPVQSNWYLVVEKGENGAPGAPGTDGEQGAQGPEGPTGPLSILSDVYDFLTPELGDALIYSATDFGNGPEMWNSGKIALGYNTVNDYVSSVNSIEAPANEWITINSSYNPEASGEKTVGIKFNKEKLFEDNGNGKIKSTFLPSYVDDVVEYADLNSFPNAQSASTGIIYVALDTNKAYRWSGNTYVEISASIGQASGLNGNVTFNLTGDVTGSVATSLQAGSTVNLQTTIQPNSVALGTDTTGSYVQNLVAGTGITLSNNAGESATPTVSLTSGIATAGTYKSVTVDTYGRVTAGTNPTTLAGYGITDAQPLDSDLTNIAGLVGTSGYLKKTAANTWTLVDSTFVDTTNAQTIEGTKTFSNTITGSISGNAGTATALANPRNFSLTGDVTAPAISFNGTGAVALNTSIASGSITNAKLANSSITVSNGSASEAIALGDTLNFTGTDNEITVGYTAATNTFNFSLPANINANASTASDISGLATTGIVKRTGLNTFTTTTILDDLGDVVISAPLNRQVLRYNGTNFVNGAAVDGLSSDGVNTITTSANYKIIPAVTGQDLGSTTAQWDVFARDVDITGSAKFQDFANINDSGVGNLIVTAGGNQGSGSGFVKLKTDTVFIEPTVLNPASTIEAGLIFNQNNGKQFRITTQSKGSDDGGWQLPIGEPFQQQFLQVDGTLGREAKLAYSYIKVDASFTAYVDTNLTFFPPISFTGSVDGSTIQSGKPAFASACVCVWKNTTGKTISLKKITAMCLNQRSSSVSFAVVKATTDANMRNSNVSHIGKEFSLTNNSGIENTQGCGFGEVVLSGYLISINQWVGIVKKSNLYVDTHTNFQLDYEYTI